MTNGSFTAIDLSQLPRPTVVEQLDYEAIVAESLALLRQLHPEFDALVESDPAYKIIEVLAYRELLVRQRTNEAALAVMLAYAAGPDLDQIGARYNVQRLVIDDGDPEAIPPVPPTYETDEEFRRRIQLSPEGYTTAGSQGSYIFHGLGADPDVRDVTAVMLEPGHVGIYVLSRTDDGTASAELIQAVDAALNAEHVRPMTDLVTVQSAAIVSYSIEAELTVYPGPDSELVRQAAEDAAREYAEAHHRMGYDVTISGVYAALHQPGVQSVNLISPTATIVIDDDEASFCTSITVTVAGEPDV